MRKELLISFTDLEAVVISCPHCHARISLPLTGTPYRPTGAGFAPESCGSCGSRLDSGMEAINRLHSICQTLAKLKDTVLLQVKAQD